MVARAQDTVTGAAELVSYLPAIDDDYTAPIAVRPAGAARMLGLGLSKLYELLRAGELKAYTVGRSRFITVASVRAYVDRRLAAAAKTNAGAA
jgi:excisionase family DNA binding protein